MVQESWPLVFQDLGILSPCWLAGRKAASNKEWRGQQFTDKQKGHSGMGLLLVATAPP